MVGRKSAPRSPCAPSSELGTSTTEVDPYILTGVPTDIVHTTLACSSTGYLTFGFPRTDKDSCAPVLYI